MGGEEGGGGNTATHPRTEYSPVLPSILRGGPTCKGPTCKGNLSVIQDMHKHSSPLWSLCGASV